MNKHFRFHIAGAAALLLTATLSFGQAAKFTASKTEPIINVASSISDAAADLAVLKNLKNSNERLYNRFTRMFANATDIHVIPTGHSTVLYCKVNGIQNNILFSNKGAWLHTVRYYSPDQLPADVRLMVSRAYPKYTLLWASEVNTDGATAYLVDIENKYLYKKIRVINGDMDTYQEFEKTE